MEQNSYLYYSTQRPVSIGTFPKPLDNQPTEIKNFDTRMPVEGGTFMAWGTITYTKPLSERDAKSYELRPSRENPDVRQTMVEQLEVVGPWEERAKMPVAKRVTYRDEDTGTFKLIARATPMHLAQQYSRAQKFPNWKEPFYRKYHTQDKLAPGVSVELSRKIEFDEWRADLSDVANLVKLPSEELEAKHQDSAKKEQDILERLQETLLEWEAQAAQTLQLSKALEYVNTPAVLHTSNEWKQLENGSWEISNLVYKMSYHIWEDAAGDKKGTWLVSWELSVNPPVRPPTEKYYFAGDKTVAEQKKKRYDTYDAAQRYIQGRFDQYVELFRELRPPVPEKFKRHFHINGCLLPEYTVALPEVTKPDEKVVESLLDYLEDGDGEAPLPPAPPPVPAAKITPAPQNPAALPGGRPKRPSPKAKPKRKNTMTR